MASGSSIVRPKMEAASAKKGGNGHKAEPSSPKNKGFKKEKPLIDKKLEKANKTILIIENGKNIRKTMSRILEDAGYTVLETASPKKGIKKFEELDNGVSLVIIDSNIDSKKGLSTIDKLREIDPNVLILLKTTKKAIPRGDMGEHLARGVRAVLKGKINEHKLLKKVDRIFEVNMDYLAEKDPQRELALEKFRSIRMDLGPGSPPPVDIEGKIPAVESNDAGQEEQLLLIDQIENKVTGRSNGVRESKMRISLAYDAIAAGYESHMKVTNHFQTMAAVDGNYYPLFGSTIIDLACGDGQLMRRWAREYLVEIVKRHPKYVARYLGVDISEGMIDVAKRKFEELKKQEDILKDHLLAQFIVSDIGNLQNMDLSRTILGTSKVETVQVSYGMHWFSDKDEVIRVSSKILEKPEGILRSIEEKHKPHVDGKGGLTLHVTPSPALPKELADGVEKEATPILLHDMYHLFEKHGLILIPEFQVKYNIGPVEEDHAVYGNIFVNAGKGHDLEYVLKRLDAKIKRRRSSLPPEKRDSSRFTKENKK